VTLGPVVHVDTSALGALLVDQPEGPVLLDWLDQTPATLTPPTGPIPVARSIRTVNDARPAALLNLGVVQQALRTGTRSSSCVAGDDG
jgi:hypothetical protein